MSHPRGQRATSSVAIKLPAVLRVGGPICIVAIVAFLTGCGGGDTTTVIERVVTSEPAAEKPALLKLPTYEHWLVKPATYSFAVDGSFVGKSLSWRDWGSPTTTGTGILEERDFSGDFNDRRRYRGAVIATGREECNGRDYYTEVEARLPANAIYVPEESTQLSTPCRSDDSIRREREPEEPTAPRTQGFYTPSHNIGCALSSDSIRCDIREKTWMPPPKPAVCQLDWGNSVTIDSGGGAHVLCAGDTLLGGSYRELPYGQVLEHGPITCTSRLSGLECESRSGSGFFLSVQTLKLF
jgi:hypothetical protein